MSNTIGRDKTDKTDRDKTDKLTPNLSSLEQKKWLREFYLHKQIMKFFIAIHFDMDKIYPMNTRFKGSS